MSVNPWEANITDAAFGTNLRDMLTHLGISDSDQEEASKYDVELVNDPFIERMRKADTIVAQRRQDSLDARLQVIVNDVEEVLSYDAIDEMHDCCKRISSTVATFSTNELLETISKDYDRKKSLLTIDIEPEYQGKIEQLLAFAEHLKAFAEERSERLEKDKEKEAETASTIPRRLSTRSPRTPRIDTSNSTSFLLSAGTTTAAAAATARSEGIAGGESKDRVVRIATDDTAAAITTGSYVTSRLQNDTETLPATTTGTGSSNKSQHTVVVATSSSSVIQEGGSSLRDKTNKCIAVSQTVIDNGNALDSAFDKLLTFETSFKSHIRREKGTNPHLGAGIFADM